MHRFLSLFLLVILPALFAQADQDAFFWNAKIGRGVNLGNTLEAPKDREWGVRLEEAYFDRMAEAGFDSVRIPVRWSDHAEETPPYRIDPEFMQRVDWAIEQALKRRMVAIVNIHHYEEFMDDPAAHTARLLGIWRQLAEHYQKQPPALYFEVLNEPNKKATAAVWNKIQNEAVALIRKTNPDRAILVAPIGWNRIDQLKNLRLPAGDRNLIASVHFYEPFDFTHQGAGWVKRDIPVGTPWNNSDAERQAIADDFAVAARWSESNQVPIHVGEFGAYGKADMASRARWTICVREEAEQRGISWSYWEFCSSFGVYDPERQLWRGELLDALLPGNTINPSKKTGTGNNNP